MHETVAKFGMITLLGVATPVHGDPGDWAQWGLAGVVVAFTLWRDHEREKRMARSIEIHERWVRDTLAQALADNTAALQDVAGMQRRCADTHQRLERQEHP